jgi:hypothetical protein
MEQKALKAYASQFIESIGSAATCSIRACTDQHAVMQGDSGQKWGFVRWDDDQATPPQGRYLKPSPHCSRLSVGV